MAVTGGTGESMCYSFLFLCTMIEYSYPDLKLKLNTQLRDSSLNSEHLNFL